MKLSVNSRLVRWAYLFDDRPSHTSLCVLFWRTVLITPSAVVIAFVTLPLWGTIWLWDKYGREPYRRWVTRRRQRTAEKEWAKHCARRDRSFQVKVNPPDPSALKLLWLGLVAIKHKVCPVIHFYQE